MGCKLLDFHKFKFFARHQRKQSEYYNKKMFFIISDAFQKYKRIKNATF